MGDANPIGVFDSGAGGISVLRSILEELPCEQFVYAGDSACTPYGDRPIEWIRSRCADITSMLVGDMGAKAVVVACNTATAAAIEWLRSTYPDTPIIGIEPAVKPATLAFPHGRILVMATAATLSLDKFHMLADRWGDVAEVIPAPCPGLADRVEFGNLSSPDVDELVRRLIGAWAGKVDAGVLGCTHYPFVARQIRQALGGVPLFDGAKGTAKRLRDVLGQRGLLVAEGSEGSYGDEWLRPHEGPSPMRQGEWLMTECATDSRVTMMTTGTEEHLRLYATLLMSTEGHVDIGDVPATCSRMVGIMGDSPRAGSLNQGMRP